MADADAGSLTIDQAAVTVDEGSPAANSGSYTATGIVAPITGIDATVGQVTVTGDGSSGTWSWAYTPADNEGPVTITVTLHGADGSTAIQTFTFTASNVAPTAADKSASGLEDGGDIVVTLSSTDPAGVNDAPTYAYVDGSLSPVGAGLVSVTGDQATFTPAAHFNGTATFSYTAADGDGGTSGAATVTVTVTSVNDAPGFTSGGDVNVNEDAGPYSATWATAISKGAANEAAQTLSFVVTDVSNASLFSVPPAVAADGTLTFTSVKDAYGSSTVTLHLEDDGDTANGGGNTSGDVTFTITVASANDAPSFTSGGDVTVFEDSSAYSAAWASGMSSGPADESGQALSFVITDVATPALFSVQPAVAADGTLTFTPAANANGTSTVTLHLEDDGGTDHGGIKASGDVTFNITLTAINDAPSFTSGGDVNVNEDAGPYSATWATAVSKGALNEAAQTLSFVVTDVSNPGLFSTQPAVAADGTLTFISATDVFGNSTVTLHLEDDGGTDNGGGNTSGDVTFTITVTSVNDAPGFTSGGDVNVPEGLASYSAPWATDLSPGPADESGQALSFVVTAVSKPSLFSTLPQVAADGRLTFVLNTENNANESGNSSTVTLHLEDNGGTANGGVKSSGDLTFTISVTNVAPTVTLTPSRSKAYVNTSVGFTFAGSDPSGLDQSARFAWTVDFGDGTTAIVAPNAYDGNLQRTHTYTTPGTYHVTASAADKDGGVSSPATTDMVIIALADDTVPPVIASHANVGPIAAALPTGKNVTYQATTATDDVDTAPSLSYSSVSGSLFPVGTTPVTITATDAAGNIATSTFSVTVTYNPPALGLSRISKVISFSARDNKYFLPTSMIRGNDGAFYGTLENGGTNYHGAAFRFTEDGQFKILTELSTFSDQDSIGHAPGTLIQGGDGNFYGTMILGGAPIPPGTDPDTVYPAGTVYRMTPAGELSILHQFDLRTAFSDGYSPYGGNALVLGNDGNLYGTCQAGGGNSKGTVYKLTLTGEFTKLHDFDGADGWGPLVLTLGSDGNFYGLTTVGGINNLGTAFRITPDGDFTKLVDFDGVNGWNPGGLIQGKDGNLYGTTFYGGQYSTYGTNGITYLYTGGTIFRLTHEGVLTTLHDFDGFQGYTPSGSLLEGSDGDIYGTTAFGGPLYGQHVVNEHQYSGDGTIFKLTHDGVFTMLAGINQADGKSLGKLVEGSNGNFYGLAIDGGGTRYEGNGSIYRFDPGNNTVVRTTEGNPARQSGTYGTYILDQEDFSYDIAFSANQGTVEFNGVWKAWSWNGLGLEGPSTNSITITATDKNGAMGTTTFTLITANADPAVTIAAKAKSYPGAVVSFSFAATDASSVDQAAGFAWALDFGDGTTETVAAGTASPLARSHSYAAPGTYHVTATATDKDGAVSALASTDVAVISPADDSTAPVIASHANERFPATSLAGATVNFSPATATDDADTAPVITYSPANGSLFPLGVTAVTITAKDANGNTATATFNVTVFNTAPTVSVTTAPSTGGGLTKLADFEESTTGSYPYYGGLVKGSDGNYYGMAEDGGTGIPFAGSGEGEGEGEGEGGGLGYFGTVFRLSPGGELVNIHDFDNENGAYPDGGLILGSDGNFYGMTTDGGIFGKGVIFRISPAGELTKLTDFAGANGAYPQGGLVQGSNGNFYGLTRRGGAHGQGTAFVMTPEGDLTKLVDFDGDVTGGRPEGNLVEGEDGAFYGLASGGGDDGSGTAFKLTPDGDFTKLADFFEDETGESPEGSLTLGSDGNFYGLTSSGGENGDGTAFRLTPDGELTKLADFSNDETGSDAEGSLVQGSDGNFYGVASSGGANDSGTVFQLTLDGTLTKVADFDYDTTGGSPYGTLVQASDGSFYGVASEGGANDNGTAFRFSAGSVVVETPTEGSTVPQTGTFADADGNATATVTASSGTVTQNNAQGTWSWIPTGLNGPATSTITITVTDLPGATATTTFDFTLANAAPTVSVTPPANAYANAPTSYTFTATDPSNADQAAGFAWELDFGDGTTESVAAGTPSPLVFAHTYGATGTYHVTATAKDQDGAVSATATADVVMLTADVTPPVITSHDNVGPIPATSPAGAVVNYDAAIVTDDTDPAPVITYSKASGTVFAQGVTTVTITATDSSGNQATSTFDVTVVNTIPVAVADNVNRQSSTALVKVSFASLLANDSDADGDKLTISTVGNPTPAGAQVFIFGSFVFYSAPSPTAGNGSFTYTLSDGKAGHKVTGTVTVTEIAPPPSATPPNASIALVNGNAVLKYIGVPFRSYGVQYSTSLGAPVWNEFSPPALLVAPTSGVINYTDVNPGGGIRLYRFVLKP